MKKIVSLIVILIAGIFLAFNTGFFQQTIYSYKEGSIVRYNSIDIQDGWVEGTCLAFQIQSIRGKDIHTNGTAWLTVTEANSNTPVPLSGPIDQIKYFSQETFQQAIKDGVSFNFPYQWSISSQCISTFRYPEGLPDIKLNFTLGYFDSLGNRIPDITTIITVPIAKRIVRIEEVSVPPSLYREVKFNVTLKIKNTDSQQHHVLIKSENRSFVFPKTYAEFDINPDELKTINIELKDDISFNPVLYRIENNQQIVDDRIQIALAYVGSLPSPTNYPSRLGWSNLLPQMAGYVNGLFLGTIQKTITGNTKVIPGTQETYEINLQADPMDYDYKDGTYQIRQASWVLIDENSQIIQQGDWQTTIIGTPFNSYSKSVTITIPETEGKYALISTITQNNAGFASGLWTWYPETPIQNAGIIIDNRQKPIPEPETQIPIIWILGGIGVLGVTILIARIKVK